MAYIPEVDSDRITDGSVAFADLAPSLQAMLGALPVGAGIDFEGFTLPAGWLWEDGAAVSRATYGTLLNAITVQQSGTRNGTVNITGLASTKGIRVGCPLEGTGIPVGAQVATIVSATAITINTPAVGSGTDPIRFFPHGNGDGSTTFNTPDARGRTSVGMDDLGDNGDAGVLDAATFGLGHEAGVQTVALTPAQTPLRAHTHSGTTATQSANHTHSGTTSGISANHTHSGTTGGISANHQHQPGSTDRSFITATTATLTNRSFNAGATYSVVTQGTLQQNNATTSFVTSDHSHNFTTGTVSSDHTHTITTGNNSVSHTHTITTGNPSVAEANGAAHDNMQPSRLVNRIVYAGA